MRRLKLERLQGFTLLEILIALAVFAILSLLTAQGLRQAIQTKNVVFKKMDEVHHLEFALSLLHQDFQQATNRPILGQEMRLFPPFIGLPQRVELTRHVPLGKLTSRKINPFLRVRYRCEQNQLMREIDLEADSLTRSSQSEVLLRSIQDCHFAFINANHQLLPLWRPGAVRTNQRPEPLPQAVQLHYVDPHWGPTVLIFTIPEALYA